MCPSNFQRSQTVDSECFSPIVHAAPTFREVDFSNAIQP